MQLSARNLVDGSKPDTPNGVNVANFQAGLGNLWDCVRSIGVGISLVTAGAANLTAANAGLALIDASAGNVTLNLPSIAGDAQNLAGALFQFKRIDNTANTVTINRGGADTIDGQTSLSLVGQYDYQEIRCDTLSTTWRALNVLANQQRSRDLIGAGALSYRNKIRNGRMDIAQRGGSLAGLTGSNSQYTLDGWYWAAAVTTGVVTVSQQADVMAGSEMQNSLRVTVTTADASVTATKAASIKQPAEGYLVRDLVGNPIAIRFEVKSPKAGQHYVSIANGAGDRSYVIPYSVTTANTWQLVTLALPSGLITAGTWNFGSGNGAVIAFPLMAGSNFQTASTGAWQTGLMLSGTGQQNLLDTVGNVFAVTGVQLEKGGVSTPFEHRDIASEWALNKRYYQVLLADMIVNQGGSGYFGQTITFPTPMRAAPSVSISGAVYTNASSLSVANGTNETQTVFASAAAGGTAEFRGTLACSAELS